MEMFIVTGSNRDYDSQDWNIVVVLTEERAKEIIEKLDAIQKYQKSFSILTDNFKADYRKNNPVPIFLHDKPKATKEFSSLNSIKKEKDSATWELFIKLGVEHQHKLNEYNKLHLEYLQTSHEWSTKYENAVTSFISENYNLPDYLSGYVKYTSKFDHDSWNYDLYYSYSKIKVDLDSIITFLTDEQKKAIADSYFEKVC